MRALVKNLFAVAVISVMIVPHVLAQDGGGSASPSDETRAGARAGGPAASGSEASQGALPDDEVKPSPSPGAKLAAEMGMELKAETFGFVDKNRDGVNDRFADVNGDGINDVNGKPYFHKFLFIDRDEDGVNDLFADADGDGVNDIDIKWVDADTDGVCDNIVDTDGDGVNDITGLQFNRKSLRGYKFGWINEEREFMLKHFIDEDMDGLPDMQRMRMRGQGMRPPVDRFIDRDGDGIDDRRQPHQRLRRGGGPMGGPK